MSAAVCVPVAFFVDDLAADDDFWLEAPDFVDDDFDDDDFFCPAVFCEPDLAVDFFAVLLPVVFEPPVALPLPEDFDWFDVLLAGVFFVVVLVFALPDCWVEELADLLAARLVEELFDWLALVFLADEADLRAPLLADVLLLFVLLVWLRLLAVLVVAAPDWLVPAAALLDVASELPDAAGAPGTASAALDAASRASFFRASADWSVACSAWST